MQILRAKILQESAELAQVFRELQLQNLMLMEDIDAQSDQALQLKQKIEVMKHELLTVRQR